MKITGEGISNHIFLAREMPAVETETVVHEMLCQPACQRHVGFVLIKEVGLAKPTGCIGVVGHAENATIDREVFLEAQCDTGGQEFQEVDGDGALAIPRDQVPPSAPTVGAITAHTPGAGVRVSYYVDHALHQQVDADTVVDEFVEFEPEAHVLQDFHRYRVFEMLPTAVLGVQFGAEPVEAPDKVGCGLEDTSDVSEASFDGFEFLQSAGG